MTRSIRAALALAFAVTISVSPAAAQCDPGLYLSDVRQGEIRVGFVARTERAGGYVEHWCLFPTFKGFGSSDTARVGTTFLRTQTKFEASRFSTQCKAESGVYHRADVSVVPAVR